MHGTEDVKFYVFFRYIVIHIRLWLYAPIATEHDLSKHVTYSTAKTKYFARQCYMFSSQHLWSNDKPSKVQCLLYLPPGLTFKILDSAH
jgi:hypothetical protein